MIITVSHQKGGVGKSTVIWNLIIEFSKTRKVHVLDLDIQKTITQLIRTRKNHGFDTQNIVFEDIKNIDDVKNLIRSHDPSSILFVDTGGFDSRFNRILLTASNFVITPVSSDFVELLGLVKYEDVINEAINEANKRNLDLKFKTHVLLNKINPSLKDFQGIRDFIKDSPHFALFESVLRHRADFKNSVETGQNVSEFNSAGKAANELHAFCRELTDLISNTSELNHATRKTFA